MNEELKEKLLSSISRDPEWYKCSSFDGISIQKVIVVSLVIGEGTTEDPIHLVDVFYTEEGKRIFALDNVTGAAWRPNKYGTTK